MKIPLIITFFLWTWLVSCNSSTKKKQGNKALSSVSILQKTQSNTQHPPKELLKANPEKMKPVFGYRFIVSGDFDGDGKQEKLIEHFFSGIDHKETNKFYENLSDYDQLVAMTEQKEPYSFLLSDNPHIDTLPIASTGQLLGLSYLKNEGDLNGDGTDEISYVVNWADWSNLNTWRIMTYKNNSWRYLYSFQIWDHQVPNLPKTFNQYGLFGLEQKTINTANNTINKRMENELLGFKGLVKKLKTNTIQVIYRNDEGAMDTMIVKLKRVKDDNNRRQSTQR